MIRPPHLPLLTVVLADPDEFTRRWTREILRGARVNAIVEAVTGQGLPRRLAGMLPCLVMLDTELPAFESPDLHAVLRERGHVAIITARRITPDLAVACRPVATGGVLAKPYTPSRLWRRLETVSRRLAQRRLTTTTHH